MMCEKRCTNCRRVYHDMMINGVGDNGICDRCNGIGIVSEFVQVRKEDLETLRYWLNSFGDECNLDFSKELKMIDKYLGKEG